MMKKSLAGYSVVGIVLIVSLVFMAGCQKLGGSSDSPTSTISPASNVDDPSEDPTADPTAIPVTIPGATLVVDDPLTDPSAVVSGRDIFGEGEWIPGVGYKITTNWRSAICYSTDIYSSIRLEFDATGYVLADDDGDEGKMAVLEVSDSPYDWTWSGTNMFDGAYSLYHLRKRGLWQGQSPGVKYGGLELKFGGKGLDDERKTWELGGNPSWDPNVTYHWIVIIQPTYTEISRNGEVIFTANASEFNPSGPLNVRIGGAVYNSARSGPDDVIYSNVKIYRLD